MPSPAIPTHAPPIRPAGSATSLRWRLLFVLVVGLLPLLGYEMIAAEVTRHATLDWLRAELRDAARQAAQREGAELGRASALLRALDAVPGDAAGLCAVLRARLPGAADPVTALAVHGADATPLCAETLRDGGAIGSGHVRAALAGDGAVTLTADPGAGLVLARRVAGADAVVALALAPSHLPPLALPLRRDLAVRRLVDPDDGSVLAVQSGDAAGDIHAGSVLQAPQLLVALRAGPGDGVLLARGAGGSQRLVGHAALGLPGQAGRLALLVELPYDPLLAEADARRREQWLAALAMALVGAASAWLLARHSLVRPVRQMLARDQALARLRPAGDWLRHQGDLAAVAEAAGEMFLRLDAGLRVHYASPATRALLGYAPGEVIDAALSAEPGWEPCQAQLAALRGGATTVAPCRIAARRRDDGVAWLEVRASRLSDGGFMLACRDVGAERELTAKLEEARARLATLALSDVQSGLANRRRFDAALEDELRRARRAQEPLSLVLLRLADWPGQVARRGAAEADAVVRRVARILTGTLRRPGDLAARLDEDSFAVLLPTTDRIGVQRMAERLRDALAAEWREAPEIAVGSHIGACSVLPSGEDERPEAVLALAGEALREAEQGGRGVPHLAPPAVPVRQAC